MKLHVVRVSLAVLGVLITPLFAFTARDAFGLSASSSSGVANGGLAARSDAIPADLAVPNGNFVAFQLAAQGVQIYVCQVKTDDPTAFEWAFRAPEADLMNERGELVGKHYAGPTWEGLDGSSVAAAAHASGSPDATAIPWLLLQAQSNDGAGLFSTVTYVQRLNTSGGLAPAEGCSAYIAGQELRVPYTATYAFAYPVMTAGE